MFITCWDTHTEFEFKFFKTMDEQFWKFQEELEVKFMKKFIELENRIVELEKKANARSSETKENEFKCGICRNGKDELELTAGECSQCGRSDFCIRCLEKHGSSFLCKDCFASDPEKFGYKCSICCNYKKLNQMTQDECENCKKKDFCDDCSSIYYSTFLCTNCRVKFHIAGIQK